jgi:hypothetical protein
VAVLSRSVFAVPKLAKFLDDSGVVVMTSAAFAGGMSAPVRTDAKAIAREAAAVAKTVIFRFWFTYLFYPIVMKTTKRFLPEVFSVHPPL